jgi:hypothetical protein
MKVVKASSVSSGKVMDPKFASLKSELKALEKYSQRSQSSFLWMKTCLALGPTMRETSSAPRTLGKY